MCGTIIPAYERLRRTVRKRSRAQSPSSAPKVVVGFSGEALSNSEIDNGIGKCITEIQDINDNDWIDEAAADAASSLCYALRCRKTGEAQEAAWATQPLYDTLDHFVINTEDIDINQPGS